MQCVQVSHLQYGTFNILHFYTHQHDIMYIWHLLGDSPLDLPVMHKAHQTILVVREERSRRKSMSAWVKAAGCHRNRWPSGPPGPTSRQHSSA